MMPVSTKKVDMTLSENFEASLRSLCGGMLTVITMNYSWNEGVSRAEYAHALELEIRISKPTKQRSLGC